MAILQRTPPARRPVSGLDGDHYSSSSPSRGRLMRSSERKPASQAELNGFPSLDSMAADHQAAMSLGGSRISPIQVRALIARNSVEASGRSIATSSANSRKVLGGQVGRNGPILSTTVARSHPNLGDSQSRHSNSPHTRIPIPKRIPSPVKVGPTDRPSGPIVSRDQSPAIAPISGPHDPATRSNGSNSRDTQPVATITSTVSQSAFEAQVELALTSGADPFQDKKRELMRGDSRMPVAQHQEQLTNNGPRRSFLQSVELNEKDVLTPAASVLGATDLKSNVTLPQSPLGRAEIHKVFPSIQSPASLEPKESEVKLKAQLEEKLKQVNEAQAKAAKAQYALKEKEMIEIQQRDMIKKMERRMLEQSSSNQEVERIQLCLVAFEWQTLREKVKLTMARGEESREREIDAILSRNEITYMDARRTESELDLEAMQGSAAKLRLSLVCTRKKNKKLSQSLNVAESQRRALLEDRTALHSKVGALEGALAAERQKCEALEDEIKGMKERVAKEESQARQMIKSQLRSPMKIVGETRKSSPVRRMDKNDKENISPVKIREVSTSKVNEAVRQSPRKKLSAFVRSTSAKLQSTVMRQSDGIADDDQGTGDVDISEVTSDVMSASAVSAGQRLVSKTKSKKAVKGKDIDSEEEVESKEATLPKKKGSILSRGKNTIEKKAVASTSIKIKRKVVDEEEDAQMMDEVQQTPILVMKRTKENKENVRAASRGDVSLDAEATPVVTAKSKQKPSSRVIDETTKTPMIQIKKRRNDTERQESGDGETQIDATFTVVKKSSTDQEENNGQHKKKKRRILKQSTNVANGFMNCNGDTDGGLEPTLNLPLQLSPIKGGPTSFSSSATTLGNHPTSSSRIFGR